jgi:hypothetical protein
MSVTKCMKVLVLLMATAVGAQVHAQIAYGGTALGLLPGATLLAPVPTVQLPHVGRDALMAEDTANELSGVKGPYRFGVDHPVDLAMDTHGTWTTLRSGERVWRLAIRCPDAASINFIFAEYHVPDGAWLFVHNDAGDQLGAYTANSNGGRPSMGVSLLPGERITIEYHEPAHLAGQGRLHIAQVTHGYRDPFAVTRDLGDSGACNINVICPEGDEWRDQIRSVAILVNGGSGFCTGTLLNNCAEDGTPYFLTADHCLNAQVANWTFRFNWDSPTCDPTENGPMDQTVSGCQLLVNSAGTDVALLELNTVPPEEYNVYYSGWDKSTVPAERMTGIHHPRGDIKKISHSEGAAITGTFSGAPCWQVSVWDAGTTEPGSSGSGLWNQNKQIVGQLYGGAANCANSVNDYYGKLDVSWPLLEPWLGASCGDTLGGWEADQVEPIVNDAAITSITNIAELQCGEDSISPRVTLKNNGTVIMSSATITYGMDGGPVYVEEWSGNLLPGQTVNVSLPAIPVLPGENVLSVSVSAPNGGEDQSPLNDTWTFTFTASLPAAIVNLILTLDNYGSDITWHLDSETGTTLYNGGPYSDFQNGTVDSVAFCLSNGCYSFTINDAFGDGLCCDAGNGWYVIRDMQGTEYAVNEGRFGDTNTDDFCLTGVSVAERERAQALNVYPNPSDGTFTVDLSRMDAPSHYVLTDALGRVIVDGTIPKGTAQKTFELGNEAPGLYLITVRHARGNSVQRMVLGSAQ